MSRALHFAMDVLCGVIAFGGGACVLFFLGVAIGARIAG